MNFYKGEMEIWQWLPGHEKVVEVSNLGRVAQWLWLGNRRDSLVHVLDAKVDAAGYHLVPIRGRLTRVDKLVARTFIGPETEDQDIVHLDGDLGNSRLSNLRCVDREPR